MFSFVVGNNPPKDSTLVCKVCEIAPTCFNTCDARMYYSYSDNPKMNKAAIYFGVHAHLVAKDMYKDSVEKISGLIAK